MTREAGASRPLSLSAKYDMWNRLTRVTAPTASILTVEDARRHLRIAHTDDDAYLSGLIEAATAYIDGPHGVGVPLLPQTWRATIDTPCGPIILPLRPVRAIVEITIDGIALDSTSYSVDLDTGTLRLPQMVRPVTVKVTFSAGYDDAASIPADLRHAILMIVGHLYERREATSDTVVSQVPLAVESILTRYAAHGWS